MKFIHSFTLLGAVAVAFLATLALLHAAPPTPDALPAGEHLYVIERDIPNLGKLTQAELKQVAKSSNAVLDGMGPNIQWVHSYVTGDKMYCVYVAPDAEMVREHARKGGFPANAVNEVTTVFNSEWGK